ncbi:MAG: bifunctional 23S rRNA (guanine(2069)-N(7))-methyltransferase RlmK/23S rRNA (guanine(2445)-N(2))-methyltransferase RlmL [Pseudomonadales bacterium]|nr:bifunctional 23S rRNA (guanine(2069)-N(7))-methyltransferase RlmK/23S rRNA (guanine(2445)-N(2))-methyltransferase RlmL [Pseudomonadales bacterium]
MDIVDRNLGEREFIVTCLTGAENYVMDEIKGLGGRPITNDTQGDNSASSPNAGVVIFLANIGVAYKLCLWSQLANRILMPLCQFQAADEQDLYDQIYAEDWSTHIGEEATISIQTVLQSAFITHTNFATYKAKDAIVDQLRDKTGQRPSIAVIKPDVPLHLHIKGNDVTLSLDLSGDSLHRRGYRQVNVEAPMKETLAASFVAFAGVQRHGSLLGSSSSTSEDQELLQIVDPMCGSGTLLFESFIRVSGIAPGIRRDYFGFLGWKQHDDVLWQSILAEAKALSSKRANASQLPKIVGFDADRSSIGTLRENIKLLGWEKHIHVERSDLSHLRIKPLGNRSQNLIISNPPYGERLGEKEVLSYLYQFLGDRLRQNFSEWQVSLICSEIDLLDTLRLQSHDNQQVYNGPLKCFIRHYRIPEIDSSEQSTDFKWPELEKCENPDGIAFANRIGKNYKQIKKWLKQEDIHSFRIYDADMPEYNMAIDFFESRLHIQEYKAPNTIDPVLAKQRFDLAAKTISQIMQVPRRRVFTKIRSQQKGKQQYQQRSKQGRFFVVEEKGAKLLINLTDYLDTGLFLDHRAIRYHFQQIAKGKRFLNLYGYTGTATIHAAMGGAKVTHSVDMSPTYCRWARSNLALNGFSDINHKIFQDDCEKWLDRCQHQYDIIFIDPPTFSNSKKTEKHFDIQADHVPLISSALKRLEPGGELYFSTNFRRFKLDEEAFLAYQVVEITNKTTSKDFMIGAKKSAKIHRCWKITY